MILGLIALAAFLWLANESGYIQVGGAGGFAPTIELPRDYGLPGGLSPGGGYVIRGY